MIYNGRCPKSRRVEENVAIRDLFSNFDSITSSLRNRIARAQRIVVTGTKKTQLVVSQSGFEFEMSEGV